MGRVLLCILLCLGLMGYGKGFASDLNGIKKGDIVYVEGFALRKVREIRDKKITVKEYLLSQWDSFNVSDRRFDWQTQKQLEGMDFQFKQYGEEMININGKFFSQETIKEALKNYIEN